MSEQPNRVNADRQALIAAKEKGFCSTMRAYIRLSGPGWLQSALTLGGGSLASSLFLGVLAGYSLLWLQPLAMILGIIMLSAIGYVAMSTTERPFRAVNRHINPVLGWGWALATLAANMVWALPQYSLATGVVQQNLAPGVLGKSSSLGLTVGDALHSSIPWLQNVNSNPADFGAQVIIAGSILCLTALVTFAYDSGGWGIKLYELFLKFVVAGIVCCFVGVVAIVAIKGSLDWRAVAGGFWPDFSKFFEPADGFTWLLQAVPSGYRDIWSARIVADQRDVIISAAATAVGINMTFLLPYSMLRRGWDKNFRGLAIFDLSTGMFIPFVLATSCVIIASATQFHPDQAAETAFLKVESEGDLAVLSDDLTRKLRVGKLEKTLGDEEFDKLSQQQVDEQAKPLTEAELLMARKVLAGKYRLTAERIEELDEKELEKQVKSFGWSDVVWANDWADTRAAKTSTDKTDADQVEPLSVAEIMVAAHLERKDAFDLAQSLAPLTGDSVANLIFGIGVLGMTLSSITLLMLISGFVFCEMIGVPPTGWPNRLGTLLGGVGVLGPFLWAGEARFWLAVPTSVFCFTLLPFAYVTFFLMMNSKSLLGENRPKGIRRVGWNLLMGIAASVATGGAIYMIWVKMEDAFLKRADWPYGGYVGLGLVGAIVALVLFVHFVFPRKPEATTEG